MESNRVSTQNVYSRIVSAGNSFLWKNVSAITKYRIERVLNNPEKIQLSVLKKLLKRASNTRFGREHTFSGISGLKDFQERVPLRDSTGFKAYWDMIHEGHKDILWPGHPKYIGLSTGTVGDPKRTPINEPIWKSYLRVRSYIALSYIYEMNDDSITRGAVMSLCARGHHYTTPGDIVAGHISGMYAYHPHFLHRNKFIPDRETIDMENWDQKISNMIQQARGREVRTLSGNPCAIIYLFKKLQELTKINRRENILEGFIKHLKLIMFGGVSMEPYRQKIDEYIGKKIEVREAYTATEGVFAYQRFRNDEGLTLNLEDFFYEFIPLDEIDTPHPRRLTIGEVRPHVDYALVISSGGAWAYLLGDTIRFVSLNPPQILIMGRYEQMVNVAGEKVFDLHASQALNKACRFTKAKVKDFSFSPAFSKNDSMPFHHWWIEFEVYPKDLRQFILTLDKALMRINDGYEMYRRCGLLGTPQVKCLSSGSFDQWFQSKGKDLGQGKVPKALTNRQTIEELLRISNDINSASLSTKKTEERTA